VKLSLSPTAKSSGGGGGTLAEALSLRSRAPGHGGVPAPASPVVDPAADGHGARGGAGAVAAVPRSLAPPRRRLHVLFADDEGSNRKLLARFLKRLGHTFVEVRRRAG
jgi:hypothetical protein